MKHLTTDLNQSSQWVLQQAHQTLSLLLILEALGTPWFSSNYTTSSTASKQIHQKRKNTYWKKPNPQKQPNASSLLSAFDRSLECVWVIYTSGNAVHAGAGLLLLLLHTEHRSLAHDHLSLPKPNLSSEQ